MRKSETATPASVNVLVILLPRAMSPQDCERTPHFPGRGWPEEPEQPPPPGAVFYWNHALGSPYKAPHRLPPPPWGVE
ncbi:hypothetical protein H2248_010333 [Termitomyces sp. 'cryptogamus']|nr:hypothetical protein H2248_010333 [Termitomyces sp. 'cryptogamus']